MILKDNYIRIMQWLMVLSVFLTPASTTAQRFHNVDVKNGLADNFVRDITIDNQGYVWISTINGLSRYDGYRFLNYQPQQWGGLSGDVVMVRETADGTLWMLCQGELFTYQRDTQTWKKDGAPRLQQMGISGNNINVFYVDDDGNLWIATEQGLFHQDFRPTQGAQTETKALRIESTKQPIRHIVSKNGTTIVVTTDYTLYKVTASGRLALLTQHPQPPTHNRDSRVMLDSRMNLWLYHAHQQAAMIWTYSLGSSEWIQPKAFKQLNSDVTVNTLAEDHDGRLWMGTENQGISIFDCEKGTHISMKAFPLRSSHISGFFADRNNTMWVGSAKLGVAYADLNSPEFIHENTNGREDVSALLEDEQGNLWIGFDGDGLIMRKKQLTGESGSGGNNERRWQLPSDNVTALATDGKGSILVGTYGGGIARLEGDRFSPLYADNDRLRYVKAIAADRHGQLWVATVDKGVVRINDGKFTYYTTQNSPLPFDGIISLAYDAPSDRIYIGTSTGLAAYDCSKGSFIKDKTLDSLKNVSITALLLDNSGRLWIGSRNGLWVKGSSLTQLTTEQGMSNNVVRALAISGSTVWASTDNGLTSITVQDNEPGFDRRGLSSLTPPSKGPEGSEYRCHPFFDSDGLHDIIFSNNAALTTHEGKVLLGSLTGFVSIPSNSEYLSSVFTPPSSLQVRFTEFRINGQTVVKSPQDLTIKYGERLSVAISIMVPALSHRARYLYRFKGEDEWLRAPNNMLYFASLMPGTHVLQVKAELPGITTTEVSELTFKVLPPFWLSNGFIACYILLFAAALWLVWRAVRRRQKREMAMKQMELNLKKYEMEEQKISFFTNISHDIKTPLTMIMAPLEKIRDASLPTAIRTEIDVAWQNARQLYDFVIELLDFQRLDEGKEKLTLNHGELVSFVTKLVKDFDHIAKRKNITMELNLPAKPVEMLFDENKMRRIVVNLLSNACKYNVEGGKVVVTLDHDDSIRLSIADTGIGIKNKRHIFDRFVQETHGQEQEGSGLGLNIVRQYVEMMDGNISVSDNQPQGTVFTVTLPITEPATKADTEDVSAVKGEAIPTILVVEDNIDARLFLQRSLEDEYNVLLASNGKEALAQLMTTDNVSIVVSDVMMPVMDGMELVRQLRNNIRYSHIPVILLTAKSSEEDIIAGLKEGVADYLTKPFSLAVLRLRIRKILEWTQHVHEQVATGFEIKPSEITVSSLDEELINHIISEVEANISDSNYSVVQLSAALGMTRGTLYKKLMAIVGKSPVEFIRILRIKRGKSLLDQGRTNISEVADRVGLSPKMFALYFKDMFGTTPSEYLRQSRRH